MNDDKHIVKVTLPRALKKWVKAQAEKQGFPNASAYVQTLIATEMDASFDRDAKQRTWLEENADAIRAHNERIDKSGTLIKPIWAKE